MLSIYSWVCWNHGKVANLPGITPSMKAIFSQLLAVDNYCTWRRGTSCRPPLSTLTWACTGLVNIVTTVGGSYVQLLFCDWKTLQPSIAVSRFHSISAFSSSMIFELLETESYIDAPFSAKNSTLYYFLHLSDYVSISICASY